MRDEETRAQQEVTKNNNDCQGNAITLPAPSESEARTPFEMTYSDTESEHEQVWGTSAVSFLLKTN